MTVFGKQAARQLG